MSELVLDIDRPEEISAAAAEMRGTLKSTEVTPNVVLEIFEAWAAALGERETVDIPGTQFLRMWLRRSTLEPVLVRELGPGALGGEWMAEGRAMLKAFPLGVVGHWPAGNIEIQPVLSMSCALLGGNACLVRVPGGLEDITRRLVGKLAQTDAKGVLTPLVRMLVFQHTRQDLQEAMARVVDGAMVWGGEEAVLQVRNLPFPSWARLAIFGPRISIAAMDADSWWNVQERQTWCRRIARDVWQFDQQACSSPQVLFLEKKAGHSSDEFLQNLKAAFESENRQHPRKTAQAALTTAICQARASWLLDDVAHQAIFPSGPDWTLLIGRGSEIPEPTQGKTLTVLEVDDLSDALQSLDGNVQTLGLAVADATREEKLAGLAASRGVDRIVKLGRMHVFTPPWDGVDLIRPMVRMVRHVPSGG
jgi:acyl-CoA reductase-like NAD-dependent aldehyde dehydrogenase